MNQWINSLSVVLVALYLGAVVPAPAQAIGDTCATARVVTNLSFVREQSIQLSTDAMPSPSCANGGRDEVWVIRPPVAAAGRMITVDTAGSNFNTLVSVWKGECGSLTNIACDVAGGGALAKVSFVADGVSTYYIVGEGKNGAIGSLRMDVSGP